VRNRRAKPANIEPECHPVCDSAAAFSSSHSIGKTGDDASHEYTIAPGAVESLDGMTTSSTRSFSEPP